MGIRSQVTSVRTNDGNCECFFLEGGGGGKEGRRDGTFSESLNGMVLDGIGERTSLFVTGQIFLLP